MFAQNIRKKPVRTMGRAFGDWLLDALFPTRCILCRRLLGPGKPCICSDCQERLPLGEKLLTKGDFFTECISVLYYENDVSEAIRRFKFHGAQAYAPAFGDLVAEKIYGEFYGKYDILSWVPLAPDRLRSRGYDQTKLIAEDAARRLCQPLTPLLRKRRGVHAQSRTKSKAKRKANIVGAFRVIDPSAVRGKRILLIDDIITTGSTLSECAKMLLMAGAEEVMCATLAVAR